METMELQCQDPQVFQAVWARVMEGKPNPIVPRHPPSTTRGCAVPPDHPVFCFGDTEQGNFLQQACQANQDSQEEYRKLEKQVPQRLKPQVSALLQGRKRQKSQLETAYFLLTGQVVALSPVEYAPMPADQRLRQRFRQAQQWQVAFQKQAHVTGDSCFTSLYLLLETGMKEEVLALHDLVEAVFWLRNR